MSEKYWRVHLDQVLKGEEKSYLELTQGIFDAQKSNLRSGFGFEFHEEDNRSEEQTKNLIIEITHLEDGNTEKEQVMDDFNKILEIDEMIRRLKAFTKDMTDYHVDRNNQKIQKTMAPQEARERELFNLGLVLIESANWGDAGVANEFIDAGFPINFQHPITKKTTLHVAVMITATGLTKTLMESGKCDLLLTDKKGNLVAGLAYTQGHDIEMYDLIRAETVQQANERGISADFSFEL